jgi:hypothetical protein
MVELKMPKGYVYNDKESAHTSIDIGEGRGEGVWKMEGSTTYNKVVQEPRHSGTEHGHPVALDDEHVGDLALDGMLPVLGRVDQAQAEEEQAHGQDEADAKVDAPQAVAEVLVVRGEHDEGNDASDYEAQVDGEIGGHGVEDAAAATDVGSLVTGFGAAGAAGWILACFQVIQSVHAMGAKIEVLCGHVSSPRSSRKSTPGKSCRRTHLRPQSPRYHAQQ